ARCLRLPGLIPPIAACKPVTGWSGIGAIRPARWLLETQAWPVVPKLMSWWWAPVSLVWLQGASRQSAAAAAELLVDLVSDAAAAAPVGPASTAIMGLRTRRSTHGRMRLAVDLGQLWGPDAAEPATTGEVSGATGQGIMGRGRMKMGFSSLSPWHVLIVVAVFVLLFGARKLPDAARSLGRSMRILKAETEGLRGDDTGDDVRAPGPGQHEQPRS
ncbi:MAG TPA: Sec-independent protein translocase subunit TatA, partial [Streptosporangiaceae bacterium]|nr:Sec-independent protein translocase subunit TatA [Streptosporangiaceae bacterium]